MDKVRRIFMGGLAVVVPLAVTVYVAWWLVTAAESLLGGLFRAVFPERYYVPGVGVLLGIALIFAVGVLVHLWLVRRLLGWGSAVLDRIPLVRTVYGSVRDLMGYFRGTDRAEAAEQTAMVSLGDGETRMLGMVTRTDFGDLPAGIGGEGEVAVYLPMSYQIGGFTVIVPRSRVEPIDLSFEEGMRLALTACMTTQKQSPAAELPGPEDDGGNDEAAP
jgi:uncharacterized membrane protein